MIIGFIVHSARNFLLKILPLIALGVLSTAAMARAAQEYDNSDITTGGAHTADMSYDVTSSQTAVSQSEILEQFRILRGEIEQLKAANVAMQNNLHRIMQDMGEGQRNGGNKQVDTASISDSVEGISSKTVNSVPSSATNPDVADKADAVVSISDAAAGTDTGDKEISNQYQRAYSFLKAHDYVVAAQLLSQFIVEHPKSSLVGNAHYWLGEILLKQKKYDKAALQYLQGYKSNPTGGRASDNLLGLGAMLTVLGKTQEACITFTKLQAEFPELQGVAKRRLEQGMIDAQCAKGADN